MKEKVIPKNLKTIYLILIFLFLSLSYQSSSKLELKNIIPEPVEMSLVPMSIAISELKGYTTGYTGSNNLLDIFLNHQSLQRYRNNKSELPRMDLKNILSSLKIENNSTKSFLEREDLGIIDFYKISFSLFGYKISSLTSTYYAILILSVILFAVKFWNKSFFLNFLLVFATIHWTVVEILPMIGPELTTVYNRRFLSVLSLLPALAIIFDVRNNTILTRVDLFVLILNAIIILLILHFRSASAFGLLLILSLFFYQLVNKKIKICTLGHFYKRSAFSAISIIVMLFIFLKSFVYLYQDPGYTKKVTGHLFWHPAYLGLSAHPDSYDKYGIFLHDKVTAKLVSNITEKKFGTHNWEQIGGIDYFEETIKKEYISIFMNDFTFFLESYLIKPVIFIKTFFNSNYVQNDFIFSFSTLLVFSIVIFSKFLFKLRTNWNDVSNLFYFLIFSFFPSLFLTPASEVYILDVAFLFLCSIFLFLTYFIGHLLTHLRKVFYEKQQ